MAALLDLARLDHFMTMRKAIVGYDTPPTWGTGYVPRERQMKYPLEVDGELTGAHLMVVCFPEYPGRFRIGLLAPGCLARLDCTDEVHPNTLADIDDEIEPFVIGPHYHPWILNRRFFKGLATPPRLHLAVSFGGMGAFDATLRWFCAENAIDSLPGRHRIELPLTGQLL